MTRYLEESFQVYDTFKRTGKIFQVGSQGCSASAWHKAAELIQAGKIGKLIWGQGYYCRNSGPMSDVKGERNYRIDPGASPETVKWDVWLVNDHQQIPNNADHLFRRRK